MRIFRYFLRYNLRYKWRLAAGLVLAVATSAAVWLTPAPIGTAIDDALTSGLRSRQLFLGALIVLVSVIRGALGYGDLFFTRWVGHKAAEDTRNDLSRKLMGLSFGYYDRQRTGDLMSRVADDVFVVHERIAPVPRAILSGVVTVVTVVAFMGVTNWRLALVALIFLALYTWRAQSGSGRLERLYKELQERKGALAAVLQENIAGMRVVQAFGAGAHEQSKFDSEAAAVADRSWATERFMVRRKADYMLITTLALAAMVWLGVNQVVAGQLTPGELTAFLLYLRILEPEVNGIVGLTLQMRKLVPSGQRVLEVLNAESPVHDQPAAVPLERVRGRVSFEGVSMSYDSTAEAVQDVSFEVEPGQLVAILGAPGSGKTTVVHLIPRFYDVTAGRVLIDGRDVRDVTLASLRGSIGIALQDVFVFGAPFRENIKFGAKDVTDEEMVRASKIARLHDFIESLPEGYDTWVGERGVKLSGGQRQRLAIARTILLDPPILVLDDSTSSVDMATEYEIQRALSEVVKRRTTFVIAHRLSSVRAADLILVMDEGRIVERGTHLELLELGGYYRRIYDSQLAPTVEQAIAEAEGPSPGGGD